MHNLPLTQDFNSIEIQRNNLIKTYRPKFNHYKPAFIIIIRSELIQCLSIALSIDSPISYQTTCIITSAIDLRLIDLTDHPAFR